MKENLQKMLDILISFLGKPKNDYIDIDSKLSFEFNCPRCAEENGYREDGKYNLSINLSKGGGLFNCWKCSTHDDEMKGKIYKLFKLYGNENLWNEYKSCVKEIRNCDLYKLKFSDEDFKIDSDDDLKEELDFPINFVKFKKEDNNRAMNYLKERGITWNIIEKYNMGYTYWDNNNKILSNRIILPSYNEFKELNFWTGRDFSGKSRQKYFNSKVERKEIIFNENLINWNNDITLCEGPFDAIVLPNSIPLLGKSLNKNYLLFHKLFEKANGNINIFLDGDDVGRKACLEVYKNLNFGRLYNKIRMIPCYDNLDPSEIYKKWGNKGIISYLHNSYKIKEYLLI